MNSAGSIPKKEAEHEPTYRRGLRRLVQELWTSVRENPGAATKRALLYYFTPLLAFSIGGYIQIVLEHGFDSSLSIFSSIIPALFIICLPLALVPWLLEIFAFTMLYIDKENRKIRAYYIAQDAIDDITADTKRRMNEAAGQSWRNILDE